MHETQTNAPRPRGTLKMSLLLLMLAALLILLTMPEPALDAETALAEATLAAQRTLERSEIDQALAMPQDSAQIIEQQTVRFERVEYRHAERLFVIITVMAVAVMVLTISTFMLVRIAHLRKRTRALHMEAQTLEEIARNRATVDRFVG
ncbi:MAG: hypothetical protein JNM70_13840 [Anaerolineae bacterium]|nr:hypothetical protein [Anaerolineae bacterium]